MTPNIDDVGRYIAKNLRARALVDYVVGPFEHGGDEKSYKVKLNSGAIIEIRLRSLEPEA